MIVISKSVKQESLETRTITQFLKVTLTLVLQCVSYSYINSLIFKTKFLLLLHSGHFTSEYYSTQQIPIYV